MLPIFHTRLPYAGLQLLTFFHHGRSFLFTLDLPSSLLQRRLVDNRPIPLALPHICLHVLAPVFFSIVNIVYLSFTRISTQNWLLTHGFFTSLPIVYITLPTILSYLFFHYVRHFTGLFVSADLLSSYPPPSSRFCFIRSDRRARGMGEGAALRWEFGGACRVEKRVCDGKKATRFAFGASTAPRNTYDFYDFPITNIHPSWRYSSISTCAAHAF